MKKNFKSFIKEMIPVLLGVLLALWINDWNDERKDKVYIENFYTSLKKELVETDKEITEQVPYQKVLVDSLSFYLNDDNITIIQVIEKAGGVKGPLIKLNYWKALSSAKIELIDYDKLSILADMEEKNEILKFQRNKLIDFVYLNMTEGGRKEKFVMRLLMMEMISTETEIQRLILQILDE